MTTVLPENALTLIILGIALWKSGGKFLILLCIIVNIVYSGFDWALTKQFDPELSISGNMSYYWITSMFFMTVSTLFYLQNTKLSIYLAGFMLLQAVLCLAVAVNGAIFVEVTVPEYELIYLLHSTFNDTIWIVECIIAWIAATSSRD